MSLLFAFALAQLLGCAFGAWLMKRFGLTTIKEKIVEVEKLSPAVKLLTDGIDFHRKKKHGGSFTDCVTVECWRARSNAENWMRFPDIVEGRPVEDTLRDFSQGDPPPSITTILADQDEADLAKKGESQCQHANG